MNNQRSGKLQPLEAHALDLALSKPDKTHWVVGQTFGDLERIEAEMLRILDADGVAYERDTDKHQLKLPNGAIIEFKAQEDEPCKP